VAYRRILPEGEQICHFVCLQLCDADSRESAWVVSISLQVLGAWPIIATKISLRAYKHLIVDRPQLSAPESQITSLAGQHLEDPLRLLSDLTIRITRLGTKLIII
jgi:hypothetical protein